MYCSWVRPMMNASEWHTPAAVIFSRTWPGARFGRLDFDDFGGRADGAVLQRLHDRFPVCSARRASSISEHRWRRRGFAAALRARSQDRGVDDGALTICRSRHLTLRSGQQQGARPTEVKPLEASSRRTGPSRRPLRVRRNEHVGIRVSCRYVAAQVAPSGLLSGVGEVAPS